MSIHLIFTDFLKINIVGKKEKIATLYDKFVTYM